MKLYSQGENYTLYQGNSLDLLEVIKPNTIDSIVTDPPYELNFMSKGWDNSGISFNKEIWEKCWQALKPGGYLLAFGGTRTFHRIACAIEDAGFEIRDTIMWLYGSGFPKSLNLGKAIDKKEGNERVKTGKIIHHSQKGVAIAEERGAIGGGAFGIAHDEEETIGTSKWEGWGTSLKPAYEPVIVARKPVDNSVTENVLKYGVGGINIDECRIYNNETISSHDTQKGTFAGKTQTMPSFKGRNKLSFGQYDEKAERIEYTQHEGRFPSNVILTYDDSDYDEVCGDMPEGKQNGSISKPYKINNQVYGDYGSCNTFDAYNDSGSASRYFYCAKASKKDRDMGLYWFEEKQTTDGCIRSNSESARKFGANSALRKNIHPTVKPVELMQYLIRLVSPKGATILDIFNGSGSTGKAAMYENKERQANYKYIGVELSNEYLEISKARIEFAIKDNIVIQENINDDEKSKAEQISMFEFIGGE